MQVLRRFARFYNHMLTRYRYPTQIATGGVLWCSGDILCQGLVHMAGNSDSEDDAGVGKGTDGVNSIDHQHTTILTKNKEFLIDWNRVARMTVYGLVFSAPAYTFWYAFLDKWSYRVFGKLPPGAHPPVPKLHGRLKSIFDRVSPSGTVSTRFLSDGQAMATSLRMWKIIGFKLFADCFIFDPLYLSLFFSATGAMEGKGLGEIKGKLERDLLPTYIIDVAVWAPIQTLNFRYIPVPYQSLVVQACNIGWNAYLSFVQHGHH